MLAPWCSDLCLAETASTIMPQRVQRYLNGTLQLDIAISSVTINPGPPHPHPRYTAGRTKHGESLIIPGLKMGGMSRSYRELGASVFSSSAAK